MNKEGQSAAGRLGLLFPGQGSQHRGMGKRIAELSQAARDVFNRADEILGFRISRVCFEGSDEELEATENTQPAILTTSIAYLAYLRERAAQMGRRLRPRLVAGHSLGQFSAAVAAESLSFADALKLVLERGRIMAEWAKSRPGGLATVLGLHEQELTDLCKRESPEGDVGVAIINSPGHTVVAGELTKLQRVLEQARQRGAKIIRLPISVPGHIPAMKDAADLLARKMDEIQFRDPAEPIVSNISGRLLTTAEDVKQELGDQICSAVHWARCMLEMMSRGVSDFIEVGPGQALSKISRRISEQANVLSAEEADAETLARLALPMDTPARAEAAH